jgi:hypothetical protein
MHPDLEAIVAADEEARSRVSLAEQRQERAVTAARNERDASLAAREAQARSALEHELEVIRAEGDARLADLRRQQEAFRATLAHAAEQKFDDAVALFLRIVCEVAP